MSTDKEIYQSIAEEIAANKTDAALWTQATVLAEGDPGRTQATYIRLRFGELKKSAAASAPRGAASSAAPSRDEVLLRMRSNLARKLQQQGKPSLYATLGLQPDASDSVIAAAIDREAGGFSGPPSDLAEFRYARRILGDPKARKEYDRKLMQEMLGSESIRMSAYTPVENHSSWWSVRTMAVVIGLLAIAIYGFWPNDFFRATTGHEVQQAEAEVQRDASQSSTEAERLRLQAENEMRQRSMALNEEAQRRALDYQAQSQERMRIEQEKQEAQERERKAQQQQVVDSMRAQRAKQYWTCINQQLDMRGVTTSDAYSRCAMYSH